MCNVVKKLVWTVDFVLTKKGKRKRLVHIQHKKYNDTSGCMTIKVMSKQEADRILELLGWWKSFDSDNEWTNVVYSDYSHRIIRYYGVDNEEI